MKAYGVSCNGSNILAAKLQPSHLLFLSLENFLSFFSLKRIFWPGLGFFITLQEFLCVSKSVGTCFSREKLSKLLDAFVERQHWIFALLGIIIIILCVMHWILISSTSLAQSICAHYSYFENIPRSVCDPERKVQNMGCKKQGAKNWVIVTQKEKRQPLHPAFCNS